MEMKKSLKDVYFFGIIFFIVDQAIKYFISSKMILNQYTVVVKNLLNITYVHNTGAAFSLFDNARIFLIIIGILAVIVFTYYIIKTRTLNDFDMFTHSLLLGGILGNLFDRIIHGYVIDYISLNLFGYHFPIFNFADICIVLSVILIFISQVKGDLWRE